VHKYLSDARKINMFSEDINKLIIFSEIFKRDNVLMDQLSQIVNIDLSRIHLTMGNMVFCNLNDTLIIIVYCS
jgi:hypothetical protein